MRTAHVIIFATIRIVGIDHGRLRSEESFEFRSTIAESFVLTREEGDAGALVNELARPSLLLDACGMCVLTERSDECGPVAVSFAVDADHWKSSWFDCECSAQTI